MISSWANGIEAAYNRKVFVTPPLGEWILAVGTSLFHPDHSAEKSVAPILTRLSRTFVEAHCWALARNGTIVRAFEYVGDQGEITWNTGKPTKAELSLGAEALEFPGPTESHVMQIASAWSIDPSELESNFPQPSLGLVGIQATAAP